MVIPKGKKLLITLNGKTSIPTNGMPLVMEDDTTINFQSNFQPLVGAEGNVFIDVIGKVVGDIGHRYGKNLAFSSHFKQLGFSTWTGTEPASFNTTIGFYWGSQNLWNAQEEVYRPAMELLKLTLPDERASGNLIGPGPSLSSVLDKASLIPFNVIDVQIGDLMYFSNVIIERAQPTFSNEVDDSGFPLWAKVNIDVKTVFTATVQMVDALHQDMFPGSNQ